MCGATISFNHLVPEYNPWQIKFCDAFSIEHCLDSVTIAVSNLTVFESDIDRFLSHALNIVCATLHIIKILIGSWDRSDYLRVDPQDGFLFAKDAEIFIVSKLNLGRLCFSQCIKWVNTGIFAEDIREFVVIKHVLSGLDGSSFEPEYTTILFCFVLKTN